MRYVHLSLFYASFYETSHTPSHTTTPQVADGKVTSLVVRPESGVLEEAFDAHGPPKMGTENQWDDSRSQ